MFKTEVIRLCFCYNNSMKQSIIFQRLEGFTLLVVSIFVYVNLNLNIFVFILALLLVDIFMAGYLINNKVGAYIYNVGHSISIPLVIGAAGYYTGSGMTIAVSLIWFAHIGMDRAFGYGLKLESGFKNTHLGHIGKK